MKKLVMSMFCMALVFSSGAVFASDGVFQKPTEWNYIDEFYPDGTVKKCRYADPCDGRGGTTPYHTAIDYQQDNGSNNVYASAEGKVVRIQPYGQYISDDVYEDHGMGNVVILKHYCLNANDCPPGGKVYTLYAHMLSFNPNLSVGDWVHRGDVLGVIGGSGNNKLDKWPNHLHFEVKKTPVLYEAVSKEECMHTVYVWHMFPYKELSYGYSPQSNPDNCGYFDPEDFIGNVVAKDLSGENASGQLSQDPVDGVNGEYGINGFGYAQIPDDQSIPQKPDFIIEELWLEKGNTSIETYNYSTTDTIKIRTLINNIGSFEADSDIETRWFLSEGYKVDKSSEWKHIETAQTRHEDLKPGETHSETETYVLSDHNVSPGTYNIVACADRTRDEGNGSGDILEEYENNNCSTEAVFTVVMPDQLPIGYVDSTTCTSISGWAKDPDTENPINVHVYADTIYGTNPIFVTALSANIYRSDIGIHAFSWTVPASYKTGTAYKFTFYGIDSAGGTNPIVGQSQLSCAKPVYNLYPTYRAYSSSKDSHLYTISESEKNGLVAGGWTLEGVPFYSHDQQEPDTLPVYRFHYSNGAHFFTISESEKSKLMSSSGWTYEGIAFYGYPTQLSGTIPVYRLYKGSSIDHLYTTSATERDNAISKYGFIYEGVRWYVYLTPPAN